MLRNTLSARLCCLFSLCILTALSSAAAQATLPYQDPSLPTSKRVDDLVSRMTLEEKISQMQNASVAIPRLGIPAYDWWNEGLHGIARSGYATVFPQAIGMAATWDPYLLGEIGTTISTEARAKYQEAMRHDIHSIYYGLTIWSPNINIFRDPRWGRGQETYGEDPYLTGRLGVSFVKGLQGDDPQYLKAVATPKHFAVHSGPESTRHKIDVQPSKYDLEDTYLPAFRATITEGHADSIMCAYNRIDGDPACANRMLLEDRLRKDWGFDGFVTSDCGAVDDFFESYGHHYSPDAETASASALLAGTDTSCGDTYKSLVKAFHKGLVHESDIDTAVKRLFTARFRLGMFDPNSKVHYAQVPFSENNTPEHRALALRAANESLVLLKNDKGLLPLAKSVRTIAVVGPNAVSLAALEGNYNAIPSDPVTPLDGIRTEFKNANVLYAEGAPYVEGLAVAVPRYVLHPAPDSKEEGLKGEYFSNIDFTGDPVVTRLDHQIDFDWNAAKPVPGLSMETFGVRWSGTITAPTPGDYVFNFSLASCYPCGSRETYTVYLDGKRVTRHILEKSMDARNLPDFTLHFPDTQPHTVRVDYTHESDRFGAGITLNWRAPIDVLRDQAVDAAKQADVIVAFVGLSPNLEGEEMPVHLDGFAGGDRTDIQLPAAQRQLLESLGATGKPLVVVLMNGSALAVNWAKDHAGAILEAWYPGESGGQAIAETLSGRSNPGGRLPLTFYKSIDQLPAFDDYSMKGRTYRYFKGDPLFAFGYGLSYTRFRYSNLRLSRQTLQAGETLFADVEIRNDGRLAGDEVAELYLTPPANDLSPARALKGFNRIHLAPGQARHLRFELSPRDLSTVDAEGDRAVRPGVYGINVGSVQPTTEQPGLNTRLVIRGTQELPR